MNRPAALMSEAALTAAIRAEAGRLDLMTFHGAPVGDGSAGFPDLVIAGPGGQVFAEVKSARGRLEPDQWSWAGMLIMGGAVYVTWRPADWPEPIKGLLARLAKV